MRRRRRGLASIVRSLLGAFPHAAAWSTELHEVLLVGSLQPVTCGTLDTRTMLQW
jgi:hypothetical protein